MLLTNQKTINYENLLAKQGKLPPYFASANVKNVLVSAKDFPLNFNNKILCTVSSPKKQHSMFAVFRLKLLP